MKKVLFFSNNIDKQNEIKNLFKQLNIKVFFPFDFKISHEPKESGKSFAENAKIKSVFGYKKSQLPCFSDDSGICIEALGLKPNIHSKRFINNFNNKTECFKYIINKTKKSGNYKAYFQTSVCYTIKSNYHIVFEGKIEGTISDIIRGKNGFGYDPIFLPEGCSKTFGEMNFKQKNILSHRAVAMNKLLSFLSN